MTTIYAATNDNVLVATILPKIAQNNINMVKLHVDFDSAWGGVTARSAVFTTSKSAKPYEAILSSDGNCIIPYEVLAEECKLYIYVKGVISSSNATKTTQRLTVRVLGGTPVVIVSDPSPSVYQQLLDAIVVERARLNNILANHDTGMEVEDEVLDAHVGYDGTRYPTLFEAITGQVANLWGGLRKVRGYGFMAEGELIIDAQNKTICAKSLLLLTSDNSFAYVTNDEAPITFDNVGASLRSIFAVKVGSGYELRLGVEDDMNDYDNVYYICGYYSGKLVGCNYSPKLIVTINGTSKKANEVSYNGDHFDILDEINRVENECDENRRSLVEYVYAVESSQNKYVEFFQNQIGVANRLVVDGAQSGYAANRISTTILPSYNSKRIIITIESGHNYACNLYTYNKDKTYVGASYHSGKSGKIEAPVDAPYFSLMVSRTDNSDLDATELKKIRLCNYPAKTTLDMIPDMLLSGATTHIKLLGDSITQGLGSTGYVGYTIAENGEQISVRGNGPDYGSKGDDYVEGVYLGELGNRRWYESTSSTGWSNRMKAYFESKFDCVVKNYGMSGINSQNLYTLCRPLVTDEDDIIILMIGTNDRGSTAIADFKANVTAFVDYLLSLDKKVVLMSSIPASVDQEEECEYHMEDVTTVLRSVAYSRDIAFISVYDRFVEYCENKDVEIDALLEDGLHPNDEGYEVMFKIISRSLGVSVKRDGATW